jgi:hypothetical protein
MAIVGGGLGAPSGVRRPVSYLAITAPSGMSLAHKRSRQLDDVLRAAEASERMFNLFYRLIMLAFMVADWFLQHWPAGRQRLRQTPALSG